MARKQRIADLKNLPYLKYNFYTQNIDFSAKVIEDGILNIPWSANLSTIKGLPRQTTGTVVSMPVRGLSVLTFTTSGADTNGKQEVWCRPLKNETEIGDWVQLH